MKATALAIPGVILLELDLFLDERGWLAESYNAERYAALGVTHSFVQDNVSSSHRGVLRGLHFQNPRAQVKLVSVVQGEVFDVVVDVRVGSPTFGHWSGSVLSSVNGRQLLIPAGCAHGFVITSAEAIVIYKCSDFYSPPDQRYLRWDDSDIGISWPVGTPVLTSRDAAAPRLRDLPLEHLPHYSG